MSNETNVTLNAENVISALCCISGIQTSSSAVPKVTPETIKLAENALLCWEQSSPSPYALSLIQIMTKTLTEGESVSSTPRLAAALSLKALVGRKWKDRGRLSKKKAVILLDDATKQHIRGNLLSLITASTIGGKYAIEDQICVALIRDKPFMTTLSATLAKIGNYDLPLTFKELIPTLVGYSIGEYTPSDPSITAEVRLNTATALEYTLGDICSKRLLVYKKYTLSIATAHLPGLVSNGFQYSMTHLKTSDAESLHLILGYTLAMSRILNHLILSSLSSLSDSLQTSQNKDMTESGDAKLAVDQVFQLLLEYIPMLCNCLLNKNSGNRDVGNFSHDDDVVKQLKSLLTELHSMVVSNQKAHPLAFARYLPHFLTLFTKDLEMMVMNKDSEVFLVIPRMSFLANVISCPHYVPDGSINESLETWRNEVTRKDNTRHAISSKGDISIDPNSISAAVDYVWSKYLTVEQINKLVEISLNFMTLNEDMLSEWSNDPELFYIERRNANADDDMIACAQNLYLALLESKCREAVIGIIGSFLFRVDEQIKAVTIEVERGLDEDGYESIVYWDSVYTALGLSFDILKQALNFDINNWFISCLSKVLQMLTKPVENKRLPILRNRLLWLCGFNYLNQNQNSFQAVFPLLQYHLNLQNDAVVQLSTVQALTNIIADPPSTFASSLHSPEHLIASLYSLILELDEFESKSDCLSLIQLLLSTCRNYGLNMDNQQQVAALVKPLESIWNSSQHNHFFMLRNSVLSIIRCIAAFGGNTTPVLYPITFPLLHHALDCKIDQNQHLISDSLDLLLTLLRVATSYESYFSTIFNRIKEILEQDFEHLKKLMLITEGYLILGGNVFIQEHSSSLVKVFQLTLTEVTARGMAYVNLAFEALLKQNPALGGSALLSSGLIATMIKSCAATYRTEKQCESMQVIEIYLTVFSRILLAVPTEIPTFLNLLKQCNFNFDQLIDLYFMQFESNDSLRQKLWIMFLLSLLVPTALGQIPDTTMLATTNLNKTLLFSLSALQENRSMAPYSVDFFYESDEDCLDLHKEQYDHSLQIVSDQDICNVTNFRMLYSTTMQQLEKVLIASENYQLLKNVDQEVVSQINNIIQLR